MELIEKRTDYRIPPYGEAFWSGVLDSYVYAGSRDVLSPLYERLYGSREALSFFSATDFNDERFLDAVYGFLNGVDDLFAVYYSNRHSRVGLVDGRLLEKIVEGDMYIGDDGELRVCLGNPMILESLVLAKLNRDDYESVYGGSCDEASKVIFREHLMRGIEALFRDIDILYGNEYYSIVGFDTANRCFVARPEADAECDVAVPAMDLYGDIARLASEKDGEKLRVMIIGRANPDDVGMLRETLGSDYGKVDIVYVSDRGDVERHMGMHALDNVLVRYDDVRILGFPGLCPRSLAGGRRLGVAVGGGKSVEEDLSVEDSVRDFRNGNNFARLYSCVQNLLLGIRVDGIYRTRRVDFAFFDHMLDVAKRKMGVGSGRRAFVYMPREVSLGTWVDDVYDAVCTETNESKGYRYVTFGDCAGITASRGRTLHVTYLDILSAISPSYEFYCEMTGVEMSGDKKKCSERAVRIAHRTDIAIEYDAIEERDGRRVMSAKACIRCGVTGERFKEYVNIVTRVLFAMFAAPPVPGDDFGTKPRTFYDLNRKAMSDVLRGHARNFNDMLFCHIYSHEGGPGSCTEIRLPGIMSFNTYRTTKRRGDAGRGGRFNKHTVMRLMNGLDVVSYDEISAVEQKYAVDSDEAKMKGYIDGITGACEALGYTYGDMYRHMKKYF